MTGTTDFAKDYAKDGVVCIRQAFSDEWITLARQGIKKNIARPSTFFRRLDDGQGAFLSDCWSRRYIPELTRFCMESPAARIAAHGLASSRVRLAQDTWFVKEPGTAQRTPWHHDTVIQGPFCSIWVALDATPRAAALEFIRGSHTWGKILMPKSFFEDPALRSAADAYYAEFHGDRARADAVKFGQVPDIEADRDAYDIVGWDMEAGDCLLFDARTVHGAPGNQTPYPVRRFITRWVTDDAYVAPHARDLIAALEQSGLNADLRLGGPIRGTLFPEFHFEPDTTSSVAN
ncbi:phytanoyl-CoA dioxygenase family protein [Pusillimonas sp. MFBS29]|uniref:phytanoyl-CoA dioxygenase family protein n=1 Tax=Pusillimonas sp. MFBS29 TaxID=2886690 RepID=UPI001D110344|nr:phytanoyl-CoA dioxygenase family protein [Pusillimonas sp. MFBS29]MCC2597579.1 phytanoyl-CoA dioxygenase family protein [Pusillimonas sp. MFBS29]